MINKLNRRKFIQVSAGATLATPFLAKSAFAQAGELRVAVYGGAAAAANIAAYVKPFEEETGIKVTPVTDDAPSFAQIELMVKTDNVSIDILPVPQGNFINGVEKGLFEKIDWSLYNQEELDAIVGFAKSDYGLATLVYAYVQAFNTEKFPADKKQPSNWSDFWDAEKFPGVRALVSGQSGSVGPWEEAMMAGGAPVAEVYPINPDRVFAKLDEIRPHVRKWWSSGSEIQQIMRDGVADIANIYDGRANLLIDQGQPLQISWNQAKLVWDYWSIVKGSPNAAAAQKFVEFTSRAKQQAIFSNNIPYGPTNKNAFADIPEEISRKVATYPGNIRDAMETQAGWYAETDASGEKNFQRLAADWNDWILQ